MCLVSFIWSWLNPCDISQTVHVAIHAVWCRPLLLPHTWIPGLRFMLANGMIRRRKKRKEVKRKGAIMFTYNQPFLTSMLSFPLVGTDLPALPFEVLDFSWYIGFLTGDIDYFMFVKFLVLFYSRRKNHALWEYRKDTLFTKYVRIIWNKQSCCMLGPCSSCWETLH